MESMKLIKECDPYTAIITVYFDIKYCRVTDDHYERDIQINDKDIEVFDIDSKVVDDAFDIIESITNNYLIDEIMDKI